MLSTVIFGLFALETLSTMAWEDAGDYYNEQKQSQSQIYVQKKSLVEVVIETQLLFDQLENCFYSMNRLKDEVAANKSKKL